MNLYIITGQECNARCKFCIGRISSDLIVRADDNLYFDNLKRIIKRSDITSITILGGEPTISPRLSKIISTIANINCFKVMTTNGINLSKYVNSLNKANIQVNISRHAILDSDNQKVFNNKNTPTWGQISSYIKELGGPVRINCNLTKSGINQSNFKLFTDKCIDAGAYEIMFSKLSRLDSSYIAINEVIDFCNEERTMIEPCKLFKPLTTESDKYFIDRIYLYKDTRIRIRCSDSVLKEKILKEDMSKIFDLKFHPNGVLSKSWNPNKLITDIDKG